MAESGERSAWMHGTDRQGSCGDVLLDALSWCLLWNWMTGEELVVRLIGFYVYLHCVHTLTIYIVDSR